MSLVKQTLINQATPDTNIAGLQSTQPKLYQAIKNLGDASKIVINTTIPVTPLISFRESFILPGILSTANDVLTYRYHVILPFDSSNFWTYNSINLTGCYITAKTQELFSNCSIDIKVSQLKGTTPFKSLFKTGNNPQLPPDTTFVNNVMFAIGSLFQDDLLRIDVLHADGHVGGVSIDLIGNYVVAEN
jgi:hypothetical protein